MHTIGQLANTDPGQLRKLLGINGVQLWTFANGKDTGEVMELDFTKPNQIGGTRNYLPGDLESSREVWRVMLQLSQDIGEKLRSQGLMATGVQITVRDNELNVKQYQTGLGFPSQSAMEIAYLAKSSLRATTTGIYQSARSRCAPSIFSPPNHPYNWIYSMIFKNANVSIPWKPPSTPYVGVSGTDPSLSPPSWET